MLAKDIIDETAKILDITFYEAVVELRKIDLPLGVKFRYLKTHGKLPSEEECQNLKQKSHPNLHRLNLNWVLIDDEGSKYSTPGWLQIIYPDICLS